MNNFSQFVTKVIAEAKFRESPTVEHLYDVPMFSVFRSRDISGMYNRVIKDTRPVLASARNDLMKIGFPAMHANVVFDKLDMVNQHTGGKTGAYAVVKGGYMVIGLKRQTKEALKATIMHEWAHLWMFNNSAGFTEAVKAYYKQILQRAGERVESEADSADYHNITDAFTDDEIYTLIVKTVTTMCANVYAMAILMRVEEEDEFFKVTEDNLKDEISRMIQHIVTTSLKMVQKYFSSKDISFVPDEAVSDRAAKRLEDYITPIVLNKVNRSIDDDIYDLEDNFEDINELVKYLDNNETENNSMFKLKGKSYNNLYNMFTEIDPSDFTSKVFKELYTAINLSKVKSGEDLSGKDYNELRGKLSKLLSWTEEVNYKDEYSLSDEDELWAVGVEQFFNLKPQYRREILKLMSARGQRELPNRTQRKYANIQRNVSQNL